ncbi:class I SAM-dependent methyltransferase [Yoonia sp. 208BN28-4]|uniref:class I SAM-dependent methyltransferase n=1 Tax=Yoonia sp. 208BN28-4 TaxID=3126505 RepID=UPI0030AD4C2D
MKSPSKLSTATKAEILRLLEGDPDPAKLNAALRYLAKWRSRLLENTLVAQSGTRVMSGPFEGMAYDTPASEGTRIARLLGCYEKSLAPVIEDIIATAPPLIIDVGCAEGFYAVGFATRLPDTIIWARDSNDAAIEKCQTLAETNGVAERVKTGGKLTHADFDICRAQPTTIICDIEGAEEALLDPDRAKGLRRADILVEVHDGMIPGLSDTLTERFEDTHTITRLERAFSSDSLPDWMDGFSDMDRLLALWEWRAGPTPWLWMQAMRR